jgi:hypothetical protein
MLVFADTDHAATTTSGGACLIGLRAMGEESATLTNSLWIEVDAALRDYR